MHDHEQPAPICDPHAETEKVNPVDEQQAQGQDQAQMEMEVDAESCSDLEVVEGDYRATCVGSCLCPCCGLVATLCCCNNLPAKHGVADGCKISMAIGAVIAIIIGILVYTSSIDCKKDKTPKNTKDKKCTDIKGATWDATAKLCHFNGHCPSKYTFQNTTKDGVLGYCKNNDHYTCLGAAIKEQPWINMGIDIFFLILAIFFARHFYNLRLQEKRAKKNSRSPV